MTKTTGFEAKCASWLALPDEAVFGKGMPFAGCPQAERPANHNHAPVPLAADVLRALYRDQPLLPIEFFKSHPDQLEGFFTPERSFLSSGTTARDRSRSSFSREGLGLYKQFSLKAFTAMLSRFFPGRARGWSMIPAVKEWPTSSLAQMIAWIGEDFPLRYWEGEGMGPPPSGSDPVWLFATGFHIVAFADSGRTCPLPPGSIVIETGGTKGKTRSVTREESYAMIERCFQVPRNRIISEYGMCELASQAYDFIDHPDGPTVEFKDRFFRFPRWVAPSVLQVDQKIADSGRGSLIIDDELRVDLPWPIRSEDRAQLFSDGRFQLEGRVAFSTLKGCSLLAEDLLQKGQTKVSAKSGSLLPAWSVEAGRAERVAALMPRMLSDPAFQKLVREELQSPVMAEWAIFDLMHSIPATEEDWKIAAANALGKSSVKRWIFIPPDTHAFALLQPIFMAALLGLEVTIREQKRPAMLDYLETIFADFWTFKRLPNSWRLPSAEPADALLIYGSNETIETLQHETELPIQGFGSYLTMSLMHASSWDEGLWLRDAFSLRQQGCMSSRLLFVWGSGDLMKAPDSAPLGPLPFEDQLQLCHSEVYMGIRGFQRLHRPSPQHPLLAWKHFQAQEAIEELLSPRPFTLPIIRLSESQLPKLLEKLGEIRDLKKLSVDQATADWLHKERKTWEISALGRANQAAWNGLHEARSLFGMRGLSKV